MGSARATDFMACKTSLVLQHGHFGSLKLELRLENFPCVSVCFQSPALWIIRLLNLTEHREKNRKTTLQFHFVVVVFQNVAHENHAVRDLRPLNLYQ